MLQYILSSIGFTKEWIFHSNISLKASSWSLTWDTMRSPFPENMYVYQGFIKATSCSDFNMTSH